MKNMTNPLIIKCKKNININNNNNISYSFKVSLFITSRLGTTTMLDGA
jgi:hypothetical protein